MNNDSYHFWRKNVRPGTSFGPFSRPPTPWQRFYDWAFGKPSATPVQPKESTKEAT